MLTTLVELPKNNLTVLPVPLEVVISEEGVAPLTFVLPPLEDILEMRGLKDTHFSLKEFVTANGHDQKVDFIDELNFLEKKRSRFEKSTTYLNRLANLAEMAGMRERENSYLKEARTFSNDNFFEHRIGENLLARNYVADAEKLFASLDLKSDLHANLRMAFFNIQRQQFEAAQHFVVQALNIDSLNSSARMLEGALAIVQGKYEQSIRSFRIAEEERPESSIIRTNMAIAYLYLRCTSKALIELKKAVALDPLNKNAVMLLADLSFYEKRDEDAIPSLRFFLEFEQKNPEIWARLARACLKLGNVTEAIATLKRQGSIADTSSVWNNLGVAYALQKNYKKAFESYFHAMRKGSEEGPVYFLAARNVAQLFSDQKKHHDLAKFTTAILAEDHKGETIEDNSISDIWTIHLHTIFLLGRTQEFIDTCEQLIYRPNILPRLQVWLISSLIAHLALSLKGDERVFAMIEQFEHLEGCLRPDDKGLREVFINNIAFFYAEKGLFEKAEKFLQKLSWKIHKDAYPTATLGLINIRKGHIERGEYLYEEAIHLAHNKSDKVRIRQKLNFELAKLHLTHGTSKALRYLQKVIDQPEGSRELVSLAKHAQKGLLQ